MRVLLCLLLPACVGVATHGTIDTTDPGTPSPDAGTADDVGVGVDAPVDAPPGTDAGPGVDSSTGFDGGTIGSDPRSSATVYWIGHSLMSHRDYNHPSSSTLFELMGEFARAGGYGYDEYRHTTPGAPLSWNWNEEAGLRSEIESRGARYDVMVMTEGISLIESMTWHSTPFYAQRFQCAMQNANPSAEVFLYESWHHLYGSDPDQRYPEPHVYDWRARLDEDRPRWEQVIDDAARADLPNPDSGFYDAARCTPARPMRLIPVGTAIGALVDAMETGDARWEGLTRHQLVQNGYRNWPEEWPVAPGTSVDWRARMSTLQTIHGGTLDDIHASRTLIYFVALVHYATVYRRTPVGLPAANGVSAGLAQAMQELAWNVVLNDPRAGVR